MTDSRDIRGSAFRIPMGLLASGDPAMRDMEKLIEFRQPLLYYQYPKNGKRDLIRRNGLKQCAP